MNGNNSPLEMLSAFSICVAFGVAITLTAQFLASKKRPEPH